MVPQEKACRAGGVPGAVPCVGVSVSYKERGAPETKASVYIQLLQFPLGPRKTLPPCLLGWTVPPNPTTTTTKKKYTTGKGKIWDSPRPHMSFRVKSTLQTVTQGLGEPWGSGGKQALPA